jgi:hypothetical protein
MRRILLGLERKSIWIAPSRERPVNVQKAISSSFLLHFFAIFFLLLSPALDAATFTASLDRDTITVGESATLTLTFDGGDPKGIPAPPNLPNLQISNGGNARNVSIVNGQVSSSISQNYVLTPTQPGEYNIPALTAQVGNETLSTQPVKLTAVKAAPNSPANAGNAGDRLVFVKVVVPKKELFVGEVESVELQTFVRDNVANAEGILQWCDSGNGPALKAEGFTVIKSGHARWRRAQAGNATYYVATLVAAISPLKAGPLPLGCESQVTVQIPLPNQRPRDPFFSFFNGPQVEQKQLTLEAEPETINALPLPKENVPASFNGAVGSYTMAVSAGPTNVAAGDPITVKVQLAGRGVLDALTLPEQSAWHDFKTFPPTSKVESTDPLGVQGSKTFEQVIVPQSTDIKELPPVSFSYFDAEQKAYRTLTQPAIKLTVRPGGSAVAPSVAVTQRTPDNPPPSQDIVPIKERAGTLAQIAPPLLQQPWFLALQGVPLIAFVGALAWRKRMEALANNPRLRRHRQVAQIVRDGLADLRRFAAANQSENFFATLVRLLQEQLGERLDLPASSITEAVIEENLRPRGVPEATLAPLHELFQTCNLVRYAPIKTSQELAALIPQLESVLRSLREVKA